MWSWWTQGSVWPTDWSQKVWQSEKLKPGLLISSLAILLVQLNFSSAEALIHTLVCNTNIDLAFTLSIWSDSCYTNSRLVEQKAETDRSSHITSHCQCLINPKYTTASTSHCWVSVMARSRQCWYIATGVISHPKLNVRPRLLLCLTATGALVSLQRREALNPTKDPHLPGTIKLDRCTNFGAK